MPRAAHSSSVGRIKPFFGALGGIRVVHAASRHVFPRHSHDEFGIGIITAGCQRSSSGRGIVCAEEGDVITVSPGEVHDGAPAYADSRSWSMIYLEPDLVGSFERELSGREQELEFAAPLLRDPTLAAQVRNLITIAQMEGLAAQAIALEQALCAVLAMTLHHRVQRRGTSAPGAERVKELIDDLYFSDLTLADMSRLSGLSRFQIIRGMRKLTGLTPHQYLMFRRIERARRAIAAGWNLADAAVASGFYDQSHMNRHFRRLHGFAPGELKPGRR